MGRPIAQALGPNIGAKMSRNKNVVYLYLMGCEGVVVHSKIGIAKNPNQRLKCLQCGNPNLIWLEARWSVGSRLGAETYERILHAVFDSYRVQGEWFSVAPKDLIPTIEAVLSDVRTGNLHGDDLKLWSEKFEEGLRA